MNENEAQPIKEIVFPPKHDSDSHDVNPIASGVIRKKLYPTKSRGLPLSLFSLFG
jgi:hypothetical protein